MMKRILVCAMAMAVTTMAVDFKGMDAPTKHVTPPRLELKGDRIELTIPKAFRDVTMRVVTHSLADAPNEKRVLVWGPPVYVMGDSGSGQPPHDEAVPHRKG